MLISTRGRYALRFLVDLAENQGDGYITTRELAQRQEVSQKYAERLMALLSRGDFVSTQHGKGGGYRLKDSPASYKVSDILLAMDEELAPVECLTCRPNTCPRAKNCRTLPMWEKLGAMIEDFFGGITLADLMKQRL
ncbi:MAG: Rrf2 family transcriptional regulator [Synergistaceae bacterium]|nr:Rrf2 family transcriptional regulator [Synergistaceae bacterium]